MERKKISVPVTEDLYAQIEQVATRMERPLAVIAGRLIKLSLDTEGKRSFSKWLHKRIVAKDRKVRGVSFRQTATRKALRVQIVLDVETIETLEELADRMNHRPVNLAALLIDHSIDVYQWVFKLGQSAFTVFLLKLTGVRYDKDCVDVHDLAEHEFGPWMDGD